MKTFSEAIRYYYSLKYDERIAWEKQLIDHAKNVKDLQSVMNLLNGKHRKEIIEKMREIAVTDEEKKIAFWYKI